MDSRNTTILSRSNKASSRSLAVVALSAVGGILVAGEELGVTITVDENHNLSAGPTKCYKPGHSGNASGAEVCPVRCLVDTASSTCVPCLVHTDDPSQPDWGCSDDRPLCIVGDAKATPQRHGLSAQVGSHCAPYPCRKSPNTTLELYVDEGCTGKQPRCVDALQNDALPGAYGMQCVAGPQEEEEILLATIATANNHPKFGLWGLLARNFTTATEEAAFGLQQYAAHPRSSQEFEIASLCQACPLSGQGRTCESNKACDTIGGVHTTSSTTHPSWNSGIFSW